MDYKKYLRLVGICKDLSITFTAEPGTCTPRIVSTDEGGHKIVGDMVLLEPKDSWSDYPPFKYSGNVNVKRERWLVAWKEDRMSSWVITASWVYVYHSEGIIHIEDELDFEEE